MKKKLLLIIVLIVLFVCLNMATSLAYEFDNVKSYNPQTREVAITNNYGFGDDLAKIRLVNYTGYCFAGDCWMYNELTVLSDGLLSLEEVKYYNPRGAELNNKDTTTSQMVWLNMF